MFSSTKGLCLGCMGGLICGDVLSPAFSACFLSPLCRTIYS